MALMRKILDRETTVPQAYQTVCLSFAHQKPMIIGASMTQEIRHSFQCTTISISAIVNDSYNSTHVIPFLTSR